MTEDKEARLKEIEGKILFPYINERNEEFLEQVDASWLLTELRSAWEREKILRDVIEYAIGPTRDVKTPKLIEALAKAEQVTPGVWVVKTHPERLGNTLVRSSVDSLIVAQTFSVELGRAESTALFIAASRTLVPELADAVLKLIESVTTRTVSVPEVQCSMAKDLVEYKQKLAVATEALRYCASKGHRDSKTECAQCRAAEALAKISQSGEAVEGVE